MITDVGLFRKNIQYLLCLSTHFLHYVRILKIVYHLNDRLHSYRNHLKETRETLTDDTYLNMNSI